MAITQSHFRFGINELAESTHGWYAAEDTNIVFGLLNTTLLLRFCLQCDGTPANNVVCQFQYNRNGAGWVNITTTSSVIKAVTTSVFANAANTTQRLSGTGTFEASSQGCTHDGLASGGSMDIVANGNAETECSLQVVSTDVSDGDVIQFRIEALDTYAVTATMTLSLGTVRDEQSIPRRAFQALRAPVAALASLYRNVRDTMGDGEAPPPPPLPDATALLVVPWLTRMAPRAAIMAALTFASAELGEPPPPQPETTQPEIARGYRTPSYQRAAIANLYQNALPKDEDGPAPPAPEPSDATSLLVVSWAPQRAPAAAIQHALRDTTVPDAGQAPAVQPDSAGMVVRVPRGWQKPIPRAAVAAASRWQVGEEPEPYPDATAITVVGYRGAPKPERLRAVTQALYRDEQKQPASGEAPPPEPDTITPSPQGRWKVQRAPRAATANLYRNKHEFPESGPAPPAGAMPRLVGPPFRLAGRGGLAG